MHSSDYVIKQEGTEWVLYDHTGSKVLGRHPSREKAEAQERAIQAAKYSQEDEVREYSNAIRGIEIFSTGRHNGDEYTEQDLDEMVSAFKELDYSPAIKIGHTKDEPGAPAYGWIRNLRKVGTKLVADFEDMHDSVVESLRKRNYDRVSSEIYFNLRRGEKVFRRALKAVALLGAEVPAVANLIPLHKMQFTADGFEAVAECEQQLEVGDDAMLATLAERVAGLVNLIKEYDMAKNSARIAELSSKVKEFEHKMDEMMKKKGKAKPEDMEDDEDYKKLAADVKKVSDEIKSLQAEDVAENASVADLQKQLVEERKAREESEKKHADEMKALAQRVDADASARRAKEVGMRVEKCSIPALRPTLTAVYAHALANLDMKVKVYSTDKDGKQVENDRVLVDVVDDMVAEVNKQGEKLFSALAKVPQVQRHEITGEKDPGIEIDKRVKKFKVEHPEVSRTMKYEEITKTILDADPDLKELYSESLRPSH